MYWAAIKMALGGLNWPLMLAKALAFLKKHFIPIVIGIALVTSHGYVYNKGQASIEKKYAKARTEQYEREQKLLAKETARVDRLVEKHNAEQTEKKEQFDEYADNRKVPTECLLTDDDARMLNSLD